MIPGIVVVLVFIILPLKLAGGALAFAHWLVGNTVATGYNLAARYRQWRQR